MKKVIFSLAIASFAVISCGKSENTIPTVSENSVDVTPVAQPEPPKAVKPIYTPGLELIEGSDCLSCHKTDQKLIGPSYQEIADKYTDADLELLAGKIIDGGSGVWGDVPMQAHPNISKEDAKKMVQYILSLKK